MNTKEKIDAINKEANSLVSKDFNASNRLSQKALQLAIKVKYIEGQSKAYHNMGIAHFFNHENEKAYSYYEKAYNLLEGSSNYLAQSATLHNMGLIQYDWCQFKKAIQLHQQALKLRKKAKNERFIILSLDYIGISYLALNDYENALKYYLEAYKKKKTHAAPFDIIRSLFNIGQVYSTQLNYIKAKEYFEKAFKIIEETNNKDWLIHICLGLGICNIYLAEYDDALTMLNKSLQLAKKHDDNRIYSATLDALGTYYGFQKEYKKSLQYHQQALEISRSLGLSREVSISLANIALMQTNLKMYDEAKSSYKKALKLALQIDDKLRINNFYKAISNLYAIQKKYEKAYEFLQKSFEITKIIEKEKEKETIAKLKVEFDLEQEKNEAEIHRLKNVILVETNNKLAKSEESLKELTKTLEKRVEEELRKREHQQQLLIQKSKLESIGKLAAGIAHEINQPLGGISMGLENIYFAFTEDRLSEKYLDEKLKQIDGYFDRIKQIIDHIRIFSRDQKSIILEDVDINEAVKNALSLLQTQYENHNVILKIDLDKNIPHINGNKYKLEQVILNLLTNAKDAIEEKQTNSNSSYHKEILIKTYTKNQNTILEVKDNGNGISKDNIKKIFDPFFTTKDPAKGTGLGLSIIYGIIKEINGEIAVESELGKFTTMRIIF